MSDDENKKNGPKKPQSNEVSSYKPNSFNREKLLRQKPPEQQGAMNPHAGDEMPSMVRRANEAFQRHEFENKKKPAAHPGGGEGSAYKPQYEKDGMEVAANKPPDDNFDDIIGEIMRQQANIRPQKKGIFAVKTDNATKLRVLFLVVLLFVVYKVKSSEEKNLNTIDRLRANQKLLMSQNAGGSTANASDIFDQIENINKKNSGDNNYQSRNPDDPQRLSAKLVPVAVLTPQQIEKRKLQAWGRLMTCAGQSIWSGYHSKGFKKLNDQLMVYSTGDIIYAFSPYFAGGEIVFNDWFWEQDMHQVASTVGMSMVSYYPTEDFVFPYMHLYGRGGRSQVNGAYYLKIRRGGDVVGYPVYRMGEPILQTKSKELKVIQDAEGLWIRDTKYLRSDFAKILLNEVEVQIGKFKKNESKPWPMISSTRSTATPWNLHVDRVLAACQLAGRSLGSNLIFNTAKEQRLRLRKDPNSVWFPSLMVHTVNLDRKPAIDPYRYSPIYTASQMRNCLMSAKVPAGEAFWATVGLTQRGQIKSVSIKAKKEHTAGVDACFRQVAPVMLFPGSKLENRYLSILYRYQ